MNEARFQDLVDRLGDDLATWPQKKRHDAEILLDASAAARLILAEAHKLRAAFASLPRPAAPASLAARLAAFAEEDRDPKPNVAA